MAFSTHQHCSRAFLTGISRRQLSCARSHLPVVLNNALKRSPQTPPNTAKLHSTPSWLTLHKNSGLSSQIDNSGHTPSTQSGQPDLTNPYDEEEIFQEYRHAYPDYPAQIFQNVRKYCSRNGGQFGLAVDIACGTGQATVPLTAYYDKVIGVDGSAGMIEQAPKNLANATFYVADCNSTLTFLQSGSVDLVCVASALHWLDRRSFYSEVDRLLKPGGHLVVMSHRPPRLVEPELNTIVHQIRNSMPEYFPERNQLYLDGLATLVMPYSKHIRFPELFIEGEVRIGQLMSSFQANHNGIQYLREHGEVMDQWKDMILECLRPKVASVPEETKVKVIWPYNYIIAQRPYG